MFSRSSGVLMHITSLPSEQGIGTLGKEAYNFVDFLEESKQSLWQILPLGVTSFGDSPYQSFSAFAGNHYMIDLFDLVEKGLLTKEEVETADLRGAEDRVDFGKMYFTKNYLLRRAFSNVSRELEKELKEFEEKHKYWLDGFTLFMALKTKFNGASWRHWDHGAKFLDKEALKGYREELKDEILYHKFIQYIFFGQWEKIKAYANSKNIQIVGDLPIFVAEDSADVWLNSEYFLFDEEKNPVSVAGCPPDAFSADGQFWGNPLYDWDKMKVEGYSWWVERFRSAFELYDIIRIDHFRGFEAYWEIPATAETAKEGKWVKGPELEFFKFIEDKLGRLPIIAEDLGTITPEVEELLKGTGFPGMKVLQFAFDPTGKSVYLPHKYEDDNCLVYTGTHDNDTTIGWYNSLNDYDKVYIRGYCRLDNESENEMNWTLIDLAWKSNAVMAITPMQDLLGLDTEARMNMPSRVDGNWFWRAKKEEINKEISERLRELTEKYKR